MFVVRLSSRHLNILIFLHSKAYVLFSLLSKQVGPGLKLVRTFKSMNITHIINHILILLHVSIEGSFVFVKTIQRKKASSTRCNIISYQLDHSSHDPQQAC